MASCPECGTALRTVRQREGVYFHCDGCGGRAVTVPQIRRVAGDKFATALLRRINNAEENRVRECPFCSRRMKQFWIPDPPLFLDACKPCGAVWFDAREFEAVPEGALESVDQIHLRGCEAQGRYRMARDAEQDYDTNAPPDEAWKWIPAICGLPVELDVAPPRTRPILTWSLSAVIAIISVLAFFDLDRTVLEFGMIPAEFWRYGGMTLFTSFFLHGGVWHLVSNLYFLLLLGDNVEDCIGKKRMVLLLLAATVLGDVLHALADPRSTEPCIGASGGISGVLTFYALQFPRAKLGFMWWFMWRFYWLRLPAWGAFALWILLQGAGVLMQLSGFSNVSALAHLGGVAAGVGWWLVWRRSLRANETDVVS